MVQPPSWGAFAPCTAPPRTAPMRDAAIVDRRALRRMGAQYIQGVDLSA